MTMADLEQSMAEAGCVQCFVNSPKSIIMAVGFANVRIMEVGVAAQFVIVLIIRVWASWPLRHVNERCQALWSRQAHRIDGTVSMVLRLRSSTRAKFACCGMPSFVRFWLSRAPVGPLGLLFFGRANAVWNVACEVQWERGACSSPDTSSTVPADPSVPAPTELANRGVVSCSMLGEPVQSGSCWARCSLCSRPLLVKSKQAEGLEG